MLFIDKLVKAEQEALAQPGDPRRGVVAVLRAFEGTEMRMLVEQATERLNIGSRAAEDTLNTLTRLIVAEAGR